MSGAVGKWETRYMFALVMSALSPSSRLWWFLVAAIFLLMAFRRDE